MTYFDSVQQAAGWVRERIGPAPDVAIVLGSGLGDFTATIGDAMSFPYGDIPNWPASAVVGHAGQLVVGTMAGKRVAALSGRAHFYEGHDLRTVTFATRVIGMLGVKTLILTNAAGGINLTFKPGTLMLMDDHLNLMGSNPLVGANDERFGPRFPDMSEVYSTRLRQLAGDAARAQRADAGARRLRRAARTELRNAGGNPVSADDRRRRRRDVDRARSDRRAPHGRGGARHLVHHQHGCRRPAAAARPRRGDGRGAARPRRVLRASGGHR